MRQINKKSLIYLSGLILFAGLLFLSIAPMVAKAAETVVVKSATLSKSNFSCVENSSTHKIYCLGGPSVSIAEYNPGLDAIVTKSAVLSTIKNGLSCAENSATNKIYCFGGEYNNTTYYNQVIEYNPSTDVITTKSAVLPAGRGELSCAEDSATHKIYCFGGQSVNTTYNQIIEYNPSTDVIATKSATLPTGRFGLMCTENSATNKIYCFGGRASDGSYSSQIVEYNPSTNVVSVKSATLPAAVIYTGCAENSSTHKILCFGGFESTGYIPYYNSFNTIAEYDPVTDTNVTKSATLPTGRFGLSCAENSATNNIYCLGGSGTSQIIEYGTPSSGSSFIDIGLRVKEQGITTPTAIAVEANQSANAGYDFGGIYGSKSGEENPLTGGFSCPSGYTSLLLDKSLPSLNSNIYYCYRPSSTANGSEADFGGIYVQSSNNTHNFNNPLTGGMSCPSGYTASGTYGGFTGGSGFAPMYRFNYCYKDVTSVADSARSQNDFGGIFNTMECSGPQVAVCGLGATNPLIINNPLTGGQSCSAGFTRTNMHMPSGDGSNFEESVIDIDMGFCTNVSSATSPLRIEKNGTVYGIALVDPSDPAATSVRIKIAGAIKALRKFVP